MVLVDDQHLPLVDRVDPVVILVVQPFQIALVDIHLVLPAPFADLRNQRRNTRLEVDQQVGLRDERRHQPENLHVGFDVARGHQPHFMQVVREDMRILVNRPVLEDHTRLAVRKHVHRLLDPAPEKRDLQVERPAVHILVEIADIGVVALLQIALRGVTLRQHLSQRRLAAPDISCNGYIHDRIVNGYAENVINVIPLRSCFISL